MTVGSVSFYQQDQNYWQDQQSWSQAQSADSALINVIGQAEVSQVKGLASIANQTALNRVNNQITALVQSILSGNSTSSSSNSTTGSSSSQSSSSSGTSSSSPPSPATGTGTVPLTTSTPLSTLGILSGGTINVSAGQNLTTYTSTGNDTVGNLINTLNVDLPTNAQVTASLNSKGQLVITSRNHTDTFVVGGSGTDATAIGFGIGNNTFEPTTPASSSANASGTSSSSNSSSSSASSSNATSTSSSNSSKASSTAIPSNASLALQSFTTAASILSADGVGGTLVDMLA